MCACVCVRVCACENQVKARKDSKTKNWGGGERINQVLESHDGRGSKGNTNKHGKVNICLRWMNCIKITSVRYTTAKPRRKKQNEEQEERGEQKNTQRLKKRCCCVVKRLSVHAHEVTGTRPWTEWHQTLPRRRQRHGYECRKWGALEKASSVLFGAMLSGRTSENPCANPDGCGCVCVRVCAMPLALAHCTHHTHAALHSLIRSPNLVAGLCGTQMAHLI